MRFAHTHINRKVFPFLFVVAFFLSINFVSAQETTSDDTSDGEAPAKITFPIPELGNCESKESCRAYCSDSAHSAACISFAETHGLMKSDEVKKAREFLKIKGPGGCVGQACKSYCADTAHTDECIAFAKEHHLISERDSKIADEIRTNGGPGGCKSMIECKVFCSDAANRDTCTQFAKNHDLVPPRGEMRRKNATSSPERKNEGKILEILASRPGPGGCTDMQSCKTYCNDAAHTQECMQFAKDNGLMNDDQAGQAMRLLRKGPATGTPDRPLTPGMMTGPGGCKNREECEVFCKENPDQCQKPGQGSRDGRGPQGTSSRPMNFKPLTDSGNSTSTQGRPRPPMNDGARAQMESRCTSAGGTWDGVRCNGAQMGPPPNPDLKPPPPPRRIPRVQQSEPTSMMPLSSLAAAAFTALKWLFE